MRGDMMVFGFFKRGEPVNFVPTVKFDPMRVTEAIRADLWERIQEFEDLPLGEEQRIFDAAVVMAQRGRDLHHLAKTLEEMGVTKSRASYIAHYLGNRSTALMDVARSRSIGLTEGKWMHSGAACYWTSNPSPSEKAMDAAHKVASGKVFRLDKGLKINGEWTFPGLKPGCKCCTNAIVPGFD
ncbi:hypothetical protein SAMN05518849_101836 [Sphingobium sp. AP50]|nr:hypothetical protein SAMN05518849_101836 [Sphingobium sp. AP50]